MTWHRQLTLRDLLFHGRDALYYRSAAQVLGLVDARGQPSELIAEFCGGDQDPIELLRDCFHGCPVGVAWAQWARVPLWQIDADTAEDFLAAATKLSPSTIARRAKSLQAWLSALRPEQVDEAPPGEGLDGLHHVPAARPASIELPSVSELGLPRASRPLFNELAHESVGDWDALLHRCARHAAEFEARLVTNEFLPVQDARNLLAGLRTLVARVLESGDPLALRLAWIFGRYFEINIDGEVDFAIGGLDDDLELFNALTAYLGMDELAIELS